MTSEMNETPPFSWDASATWAPGLSGVGATHVTYQPVRAAAGAWAR